MDSSSHVHKLLEKVTGILPVSDEDLVNKGIADGVSERIIDLNKADLRLRGKYGSLEGLEHKIQAEGVSPDDHTLYADFLEWRAINHELAELLPILETL